MHYLAGGTYAAPSYWESGGWHTIERCTAGISWVPAGVPEYVSDTLLHFVCDILFIKLVASCKTFYHWAEECAQGDIEESGDTDLDMITLVHIDIWWLSVCKGGRCGTTEEHHIESTALYDKSA